MLKLGSQGSEVAELQTSLEKLGYELGAIDGDFGPKTEAAVKRYQSDKELVVDGEVGPITSSSIELDLRTKEETAQKPDVEDLPTSSPVKGRVIRDDFFKWIYALLPAGFEKLSNAELFQTVLEIFENAKVRESGGNNKGKLVEWMQDTVGNVVREPWCVSAPQSAIAFVERLRNVKSLVPVSEHVQSTYNLAPASIKISKFETPCLLCYKLVGSSSGHMATGIAVDKKGIATTLEGNTSAGNDRDGDGFYRRTRKLSGFGKFRLMGMLKVF